MPASQLTITCIELVVALFNGILCRRLLLRAKWKSGILAALLAVVFFALAVVTWTYRPVELPVWFKAFCDKILTPLTLWLAVMGSLAALVCWRKAITSDIGGLILFNGIAGWFSLSLSDEHFRNLVSQPDNIAIVAMLLLLVYFLWLGLRQAVENDRRLRNGNQPIEADFKETVLTWPDLVYIELICMLLLLCGVLVWSLLVPAPLEEPATPSLTPNPAKAPWYFVGLQEMLVFFDASVAGVVIPLLIIFGLMAIPYLDPNPRGNGYYSFEERPFAVTVFLLGFVGLWVFFIVVGTFFRGPNWAFFGLYEPHTTQNTEQLVALRLSEYFWTIWLGKSVPETEGLAGLKKLAVAVWRELPGIVAVSLYFVALPAVAARTVLRRICNRLGRTRYAIVSFLLLAMMAVPLKMLVRLVFRVSYVVAMPEYSLYL